MLPKSKRVSKVLFGEILKKGSTLHSPHFYLRRISLEPKDISRFSFVVPKKVEKVAAKRNTIKRKAMAILREYYKNIVPGYAGVFFAKPGVKDLEYADYKKELSSLLTSILIQ